MKRLSILCLALNVAFIGGATTFNVTHDVDDAYGFRGVDSLTSSTGWTPVAKGSALASHGGD